MTLYVAVHLEHLVYFGTAVHLNTWYILVQMYIEHMVYLVQLYIGTHSVFWYSCTLEHLAYPSWYS